MRHSAKAFAAILGLMTFDAVTVFAEPIYPWCTRERTRWGTMECLYKTEKQCLQSAWGNGQDCVKNPEYWWKTWYPNSKDQRRR